MRPLVFHRHAASYLKRMPPERKAQVITALEAIRELPNPGRHPDVKAMQGEWSGTSRLRVGNLRVIFRLAALTEGGEVVDVLQIGPRGDIYK